MEVFVGRPKKLYRYSERTWLERSLRFGEFRLRPASDYLERESAAARQDDERNRVSVLQKGTFVMTLDRTGEVIDTISDVTQTSSIDRDYFTLCFSSRWDPLHFTGFDGSDACLIIHDPVHVIERIHSEIERQFPGWTSLDAPVSYGSKKNSLGVPFTKPEQFVFQSEYRLVLVPPVPQVLAPTMLVIGSIESVAEIVGASYDPAAI
jgi:hypothetical protein